MTGKLILYSLYNCQLDCDVYLEGRGGKFAGPSVRRIISKPLLDELGKLLPPSLSSVVVDYLASLKSLHDVCMAVELAPDWPEYIERFRQLFLVLYHHPDLSENEKKVNCTYKVHNLISHLPDHFR